MEKTFETHFEKYFKKLKFLHRLVFFIFITTFFNTGRSSVSYATGGDTATAGTDYTSSSGSIRFAAGQTRKTFNVSVKGDTLFEPNETFNVNLPNCSGCSIVDSQGIGTILNDDKKK